MVRRIAFTLVELLVVMAVIGILVGLLLPAVQMARETARRTQCSNNLKNIGLAIHHFESAHRAIPIGSERLTGTEHAWSSRILPYLEQTPVHDRIDWKQPWNHVATNESASLSHLSVYRCPSAVRDFPGKQDYGGIIGTTLTKLPLGDASNEAFGCGALLITSTHQRSAIGFRAVVDGLSSTICVAESVDRNPMASGRWACGLNCFAQFEGLNVHNGQGDMESKHPMGVPALFLDGHCSFLSLHLDTETLGAICTRNGSEVVANALDF